MIKTLFKKKNRKEIIPREQWEEKFNYIKQKWEGTPANINTYMFPSMQDLKAVFPNFTQNKNDLFIGVTPWPSNNGDIVTITKGNIYLEYPLNNKHFEDIDDVFLEKVGLVPNNNTICHSCGEFSTFIDVNGECSECKL